MALSSEDLGAPSSWSSSEGFLEEGTGLKV